MKPIGSFKRSCECGEWLVGIVNIYQASGALPGVLWCNVTYIFEGSFEMGFIYLFYYYYFISRSRPLRLREVDRVPGITQ